MKIRTTVAATALLWASGIQAQPTALPTLEFVRVPGGCFQMGSNLGEKHEQPVHQACVQAFDLGKYEVTQGQWKAVMGNNPSKFPATDSHPVEGVSWNDVQEFLARLNSLQQGRYRLPTETEWEYACRDAGKDQEYAGGVPADQVHTIAWFNKDQVGNMTHPVGQKLPNGLGLHDMNGNVWEWVQDTFTTPYHGSQRETKRVLRGGSWDGKVRYVRCSIRNRNDPDRRDPRLGFRVVREVSR